LSRGSVLRLACKLTLRWNERADPPAGYDKLPMDPHSKCKGDKTSRYGVLGANGELLSEGSVAATRKGMAQKFGGMPAQTEPQPMGAVRIFRS